MTPGVLDSLVEVATGRRGRGAGEGRRERGAFDPVTTRPNAGALRDACTAVLSAIEASAAEEVAGVLRGATAAAARMSEPTLTDALHRAADRDVFVQLLCERRTDNPGFNGDSSPFPNLRARRLCWPAAKTPCRGVDACQGACDR